MKRLTLDLIHLELLSTTVIRRKWDAFSNTTLVSLSILLFSLVFAGTAFAQQKSSLVQQAESQLVVVNEKIAEIDAKITAINARIAGIPSENVDPSVFVRLNDLQVTKDQYLREKISIEAVLESDQDTIQSNFDTLPYNDQDQIIESGSQF